MKILAANPESGLKYCNDCDILLGALVPVHPKNANKSKFGECGPDHTFNDWSLPRIEALLFAVDEVNRNPNLLNGSTLGIHILDTCGIPKIAIKRATKFLKYLPESPYQEKDNHGNPYFAGVIGAMYSSVSTDIAKFLQPWKIPQVSPASTSIKLSDTQRFEYFARTVPSNKLEIEVIYGILQKLDWTLISTIISDGSFNNEMKLLDILAEKSGICNDLTLTVPNHPTSDDFENILCKILFHSKSNAVVLFTNVADTSRILRAANNLIKKEHGKYKLV